VLESGACYDGVIEWVEENGGSISVKASEHLENDYIQAAAINGYGYGNGDGDL
jgi:hypothetical protein